MYVILLHIFEKEMDIIVFFQRTGGAEKLLLEIY